MRYILLISLLCLFQLAHAEKTPYSKTNDFSRWFGADEFVQVLNDIPPNKYPMIIEAAPLVGDGVVFRVLVKPKPSNNFKYRLAYRASENAFIKKNEAYSKLGFTLIYHQKVQLMPGKGHQAVWVKNDL